MVIITINTQDIATAVTIIIIIMILIIDKVIIKDHRGMAVPVVVEFLEVIRICLLWAELRTLHTCWV
jgi:hypothetical protein